MPNMYSVDGKVPHSPEDGNREVITRVESGPVQLTEAQVKLMDGALDREGFAPGDYLLADSEKLQDGFALLASAADSVAEKKALSYIVEVVREGVNK